MAINVRTPDAGTSRALEIVAVGTDDDLQVGPRTAKIQSNHVRRRFGLTRETAAVVAAHAFDAMPEHWRRA